MTTLIDTIKTESPSPTLADLKLLDQRIIETEAFLNSLKDRRSLMFMEVQQRWLESEGHCVEHDLVESGCDGD